MRAAVITWDGGGNREPFEALCNALLRRGSKMHVVSHEVHRPIYESLGATFDALPIGEKIPEVRTSEQEEVRRALSAWLSEENARTVCELLEGDPVDIAIVDASLLGAFAACEATGMPFVALHHTLLGATFGGSRRERFEALVPPVNEVRVSLGLPELADLGQVLASARAHILPTASALDSPVPWELPLHYVGPMKPEVAERDVPELPDRFVLVSFSTTWQRQLDLLQETIDALAELDHSVVVTTGPALDPAELRAAGNTLVFSELPHRQVLGDVDAVVTHAGHGTVLSALSAGVPLICIPMGRDQHDVTRRVVDVGAGVEIEASRISADLAAGVELVLREARFADNAAVMARSIASHGGVDDALAIIDRFE